MITTDTIVAISSPPGRGIRGIIRLSGPESHQLVRQTLEIPGPLNVGFWLPARMRSVDAPVGVILLEAPRSFTGQRMAEIHLPGSPVLLSILLAELLAAGGRSAEPGEFTARAFCGGKFDLTRAEGIAATIAARNRRQLRAAENLRRGELFRWTHDLADQLAELLALVEANIDFTQEPDITFISAAALHQQLQTLGHKIAALVDNADRWEDFDSQPSVVMLGRPNVGKSSLLNALRGEPRAIVSDLAGTTRDAISVDLCHHGRHFRLTDVAGAGDDSSPLGLLMDNARAQSLQTADVILLITAPPEDPLRSAQALADAVAKYAVPLILVQNKADLPGFTAPDVRLVPWPTISVSARTGQNLDQLQDLITNAINQGPTLTPAHIALNARHQAALQQALAALREATKLCTTSLGDTMPELLAQELRQTLQALGEISGTMTADDLLGKIFGRFCIGK
jgi:tRNA modification GTPase